MPDPLWINASSGAPAYTAAELRQAMALALMYDGRNMGGRTGVRHGGNQLLVSLAGSTITVQPGVLCIDPGLSTPQGPYWVAIPAAETPGPLAAADATNPRKDIVVARVYDHDEDLSGLRLARTEYLAGVANPAPSEPAVPAGAVRLATIDVPKVGGGSAAVTDRRRYTAAAGGIVPVTVAADITAGVEGRYRDRLDTNVLERDSGAAWETVADPATYAPWVAHNGFTWSTGGTQPVLNNGNKAGAYMRVGKTVTFSFRLTAGSTTTFGSGEFRISVPFTANAATFTVFTGSGLAYDSSTTGGQKPISARFISTTDIAFYGDTGLIDAGNPFVWANGDAFYCTLIYEAA